MCLGVPGEVVSLERDGQLGLLWGKVNFGGIIKEVNLTYTPEVAVGDYVVVHVGFSISRLNEAEAKRVFEYLSGIEGLEELNPLEEGPQPVAATPRARDREN